jgi:hypothetical protein
MKTKTLLLSCLFLGLGLTQLCAQTKSVPFMYSSNGGFELPVYCDGAIGVVDHVILGDFTNRGVFHYENGVAVWVSGTYKETDTRTLLGGFTYTANFNLIGNMGHHYIGTYIVEFSDSQYILHPTVIKAICNLNGPIKK